MIYSKVILLAALGVAMNIVIWLMAKDHPGFTRQDSKLLAALCVFPFFYPGLLVIAAAFAVFGSED